MAQVDQEPGLCEVVARYVPEWRGESENWIKDFKLSLKGIALVATVSESSVLTGECSYEEQYRWLLDRIDPASSFEREFLEYLYTRKLKLPTLAQHTPHPDIPVQPDFYYERDGLNGVCVFVDGPSHDQPGQAETDRVLRDELRDRGFWVVAIRSGRSIDEQVHEYADVFGVGSIL